MSGWRNILRLPFFMATPSFDSLVHRGYPSPSIPPHDYQAFTYVEAGAADDDDVATITYYRGGSSGTLVATLTFTYVGSTNNVATVTLTVP
jgi:hypothetical protein